MGIAIATAKSLPAVTYDKIHLTRLEIVQPVFDDDAAAPVYQVRVCYRHFGVADGLRYYANEDVQVVALPDFLASAMADAAQGDMTLVGALQAIEAAVAAIIADQTGVATSVV